MQQRTGRVPACPCHGVPVAGGPARVWCPRSGRSFQADDPRLVDVVPLVDVVLPAAAGDRSAVAA